MLFARYENNKSPFKSWNNFKTYSSFTIVRQSYFVNDEVRARCPKVGQCLPPTIYTYKLDIREYCAITFFLHWPRLLSFFLGITRKYISVLDWLEPDINALGGISSHILYRERLAEFENDALWWSFKRQAVSFCTI